MKRLDINDAALADVTETVYRAHLEDGGARMEREDGVEKVRARSKSYEPQVRRAVRAMLDRGMTLTMADGTPFATLGDVRRNAAQADKLTQDAAEDFDPLA